MIYSICSYLVIGSFFYMLCLGSVISHAQDLSIEELNLLQSAANNSSHEFTECAANYMIVAQCMNNTKEGSGAGYSNLADNFFKKAVALGEVASVKNEVIAKRLDMSVDEQIDQMSGCQNIMIIWDQTEKCNSIAETGLQTRLNAWINRLAHRFPEADPDKLTTLVD